MKLKRLGLAFTFQALALWLVACGLSTPAPTVSLPASPSSTPDGQPTPSGSPSPRPGTGALIGRLVAGSDTGPAYMAGDLFLGKLIPADQPGAPPAVAFSEQTDLRASVRNSDGTFAFSDIAPGTYALIVWTPLTSFVIEAASGGLLKAVVEADRTNDLGTVVIP